MLIYKIYKIYKNSEIKFKARIINSLVEIILKKH